MFPKSKDIQLKYFLYIKTFQVLLEEWYVIKSERDWSGSKSRIKLKYNQRNEAKISKKWNRVFEKIRMSETTSRDHQHNSCHWTWIIKKYMRPSKVQWMCGVNTNLPKINWFYESLSRA